MARKLFEFRATRARAGGLAVGIEYVVWDDEAATVLADISTSSGGSSIAGSTVTTADIAGLGPSACRFYGPTDGQDTLWVTCPSDPTLGVQRVEASTDARLDALEAGSASGIPGSIFDAKGDLIAASAADTAARLAVGTNRQELIADSGAPTGLRWVDGPVINVKHPPYYAVGNGIADDTVSIQLALTDAQGGTCFLPEGIYSISAPLMIPSYTRFVGANSSPYISDLFGSTLIAAPGYNGDLLSHANIATGDPWAHGTKIERIAFRGRWDTGQTAGSGIKMIMGDQGLIRDCSFYNFPHAGIRLVGGGAPANLENIHALSNNWGVWFDSAAGPTHIRNLHGDNNTSMVRVENPTTNPADGGFSFMLLIEGFKNEVIDNGKENPWLSCVNLNEGGIVLIGGRVLDYSAGSPAAPANKSLVKISGTTGSVTIIGTEVENYPRLIDDTVTGEVILNQTDNTRLPRIGVLTYRNHNYSRSALADSYGMPLLQGLLPAMRWLDTTGAAESALVYDQFDFKVKANAGTFISPTWADRAIIGNTIKAYTGFQVGNVGGSAGGALVLSGTGTPEGAVTAGVGSLFLRTDGGALTAVYQKISGSGNTGWTTMSAAKVPAVAFHTGWYYTAPSSVTTGTTGLNLLRVAPFPIGTATTFDRIGLEVTTVGTAGAVVRLGIYADDGTGRPGALVLDAGTINGTSATFQEITISQTLQPGVYWIGGVQQVATCITRFHNGPLHGAGGTSSSLISANSINDLEVSGITGALPGTWTGTGDCGGAAPRVLLRVA